MAKTPTTIRDQQKTDYPRLCEESDHDWDPDLHRCESCGLPYDEFSEDGPLEIQGESCYGALRKGA